MILDEETKVTGISCILRCKLLCEFVHVIQVRMHTCTVEPSCMRILELADGCTDCAFRALFPWWMLAVVGKRVPTQIFVTEEHFDLSRIIKLLLNFIILAVAHKFVK